MSNIIIFDKQHYTKSGSIADRTKEELKNKGFSHLWNLNDFNHYLREQKRQARKMRTTLHPAWAAVEIAHAIIQENPQTSSDFNEFIF